MPSSENVFSSTMRDSNSDKHYSYESVCFLFSNLVEYEEVIKSSLISPQIHATLTHFQTWNSSVLIGQADNASMMFMQIVFFFFPKFHLFFINKNDQIFFSVTVAVNYRRINSAAGRFQTMRFSPLHNKFPPHHYLAKKQLQRILHFLTITNVD